MTEPPRRPPGASDAAVEAAGKVSEAFEWIERARGRLYDFHQLIGHADALMEEAAALLDRCGAPHLAAQVREDVIGRNVLHGRWTFQVVEEFEDSYYGPVRRAEEAVRRELTGGRRHVHESELKDARRTQGAPGHERRPEGP